jgi:hypothetical protein
MHVDALRQVLHAQPFRSFAMRLVDGREFPVPHPDFVAVSPRTVVVIDPQTEGATILEPMLIISLEMTGGTQPSGSQQAPS